MSRRECLCAWAGLPCRREPESGKTLCPPCETWHEKPPQKAPRAPEDTFGVGLGWST